MIGGKWEGLDEALAALNAIVHETSRADVAAEAMLVVAKPIAWEMGQNARRRPPEPDMADSIVAARVDERQEPGVAAIEIGPRRSHPASFRVRFWEFGTAKHSADPFMRPVWDDNEPTFWRRVIAAMRPAYERAVHRHARRARSREKAVTS